MLLNNQWIIGWIHSNHMDHSNHTESLEIKEETLKNILSRGKLSKNIMIQNLYGIGSTVKVVQSRLTLCNPMDCSLPGSSIHEILQASILEWIDISSPGRYQYPLLQGIFPTRDQTWVSCFAGRFFTIWATREAQGMQQKQF